MHSYIQCYSLRPLKSQFKKAPAGKSRWCLYVIRSDWAQNKLLIWGAWVRSNFHFLNRLLGSAKEPLLISEFYGWKICTCNFVFSGRSIVQLNFFASLFRGVCGGEPTFSNVCHYGFRDREILGCNPVLEFLVSENVASGPLFEHREWCLLGHTHRFCDQTADGQFHRSHIRHYLNLGSNLVPLFAADWRPWQRVYRSMLRIGSCIRKFLYYNWQLNVGYISIMSLILIDYWFSQFGQYLWMSGFDFFLHLFFKLQMCFWVLKT